MKHLIKITFLLLLPLFISYTLPASAQGTIQRPGAKKEQGQKQSKPATPKSNSGKQNPHHRPKISTEKNIKIIYRNMEHIITSESDMTCLKVI